MFYLKIFFQSLFQSKLSLTLVLLSLGGMFGTLAFKDNVEKLVLSQKALESSHPYFYAVIPDTANANYLRRKLLSLPGVKQVNMMGDKKISEHVRAVLESTQIAFDESLMDLKYSGLKVGLSPDLKPRSLNLIRNYIKRLAGENDVTLGAVKNPELTKTKAPLKLVFLKTTRWVPALFMLMYLVGLFLMSQVLRKESWLIETYQRKNKVFEKSLTYSQAPIFLGLIVLMVTKGASVAPLLMGLTFGLILILSIGKKKEVF
ncbi:MAG: hypothetical protein NXH75_02400 [Halobacteriovoraceae bacterium]|nr:hypothetical protein [Halobacteriovoraceae bacterium]